MKKIVIIALFILQAGFIHAQYSLAPGQGQFNAGIGASTRGIPIYLGFEYGIYQDISVGGTFSFMSYRERYLWVKYNHNIFGIYGFGNYHFNTLLNIPEKYDVYAGIHLGFNISVSDKNYPGTFKSGPGVGAHVGGRMFFNDVFGINAEVDAGYYVSGARFGITMKLPHSK